MSKKPETLGEQQLELPFNTGDRLPPRAAARRYVNQARSAVRALRAARVRKEQTPLIPFSSN